MACSGVTDHFAHDDTHALAIARDIVASLNRPKYPAAHIELRETVEPKFSASELGGIVPSDTRIPYDIKEVIARIVDGSEFHEFKQQYGSTLVTGMLRAQADPSHSLSCCIRS